VCGKKGCWFTKHTQEKHNKSKKRFNSCINQFILEYKGEEVEEPFNKSIKAFIIDFDLNAQEQETLKMFLTTFRPFMDSQAFNITTILADCFFVHSIVPKN